MLEDSSILIIDDEPRNVLLLERALAGAGFTDVRGENDPLRGFELVQQARPDLLVLDLHMPELDGIEFLNRLGSARPRNQFHPTLVLTADATEAAKRRALAAGANDFLTKPFGLTEALLRIRNLLHIRSLYLRLERANEELGERVVERTRELEAARLEVVERLCQAVEFRDDVTGRHTRRVAEQAAALAARLGLSEGKVDLIRRAAPLHDVGKIAIPDSILLKPARLTADEFAVMRSHTLVGAAILSGGGTELMATAEVIALSHHERWDGTGYPNGVSGEAIPVAARIVAIADVFDALTHPRQYREAWPTARALAEIGAGAGKHFDPAMTEAFLAITV